MNKTKQTKTDHILILCIILSLLVATIATVIEHNQKQVKSETTPVPVAASDPDPVPEPESEEEEEEDEHVLPHQAHYIAGWDKCLDLLHVDSDVVFMGDSITYKSFFDVEFPDLVVCNLAVSSDTIKGVGYRTGTLETVRPEYVFLMIGTNSLKNDNIEKCIKDYRELVEDIRSRGDFELFLVSVTPVGKSESGNDDPSPEAIVSLNEGIAGIADEYGATYLDLYSELEDSGYIKPKYTTDGLHLSEDAYEVWADLMRPYLDD